MKYIIIGAGLSGLQCAYILAKQGHRVCVLEQQRQAGGCLQTFRRGEAEFDTGFHFVGGMDEGQPLHRLLESFDLLDLPWRRMDEAGFAEVVIGDESFLLPMGSERFVDALSERFPHQREALKRYTDLLRQVGENIFKAFEGENPNGALFERSAKAFLDETIDDPLLRNVLSGASLTMDLDSATLPLYVFAQINNSFIQSAYRLQGGGAQLVNRLVTRIREMGGEVRMKAAVTRLIEADGRITAVEVNSEERLEADCFISTIHPEKTLELIPETRLIRKIYRKRIASLPNTFGMFTTHLKLKPGVLPYLNRNIFLYKEGKVWDYRPEESGNRLLVNYYPPQEGTTADQLDLLTPMSWSEVAPWEDTKTGRRGAAYEAFKQEKAAASIRLAATRIPGLEGAIDRIYTSSPLTYRDYNGIPEGSAFGIRKDFNNVMGTLIPVQTQLPNLFLSGQSLNLHGILGVSMTTGLTCRRVVGE